MNPHEERRCLVISIVKSFHWKSRETNEFQLENQMKERFVLRRVWGLLRGRPGDAKNLQHEIKKLCFFNLRISN